MREILFRGKRICEKKNWVEGCLLNMDEDSGHVFIVPFFCNASTIPISRLVEYTSAYVNPKTVGQFTGLFDKNGKKIFEGDIVRYVNPDEDAITGSVVYGEHTYVGTHEIGFYVAWKTPEFAMYLRNDLGFWTKCREIEVIGNIHDNPELLEE